MREVVILGGARTAVGDYGGTLKDKTPADLGVIVAKAAIERSGIEAGEIQHSVIGNVIHTDQRDMYISRYVAVEAGVPFESPAYTCNRLCGSGLQAIISAAQMVMLGDADAVLAGGTEVMTRGAYWVNGLRWGVRMNDSTTFDATVGVLNDPFLHYHMGVTAENVATKWEVSREEQDQLAVLSHNRAEKATAEGYFKEQIVPVEVKQKKEVVLFDTDEHIRKGQTMEALQKLRPAFKSDGTGTVTAGNASGINDAAATVVMMDAETADKKGLKPMARFVAYAFGGVDPQYMGVGPIPAIRTVMEKSGLSIADMDTIELNEAFASQALVCINELELPMEKVNPNGSGISIGHPIGATGAILTVKAMYELQRINGRYGLISMCIGGGQGIAAIIERMN